MKKHTILAFSLALFAVSAISPSFQFSSHVFALEVSEQTKEKTDTIADPGAGRLGGHIGDAWYQNSSESSSGNSGNTLKPQDAARTTVSPFDNKTYAHPSKFNGYAIKNGIDISKYQGSIDWEQAKAAGVEFAFVRVGYRGYGISGTLAKDVLFRENLEGAANAGIPCGVYFFSQAISPEEAREEAIFLIEQISGFDISLPMVLDYEFASSGSGNTGRLYQAKLSKEEATQVCLAFCETVRSRGYKAMVYANPDMLNNHLYPEQISASGNTIWLTNYTTQTTYDGDYDFWQYSSKGRVNGINNGSTNLVDCNFWYQKSGSDDSKEDNEGNSGGNNNITSDPNATPEPNIDIEAPISFSQDAIRLSKNETFALKEILDGASGSITYRSSDPFVATVTADGIITASAAGETEITASTVSGKQAICTVTVQESLEDYKISLLKKKYTYTGKVIQPKLTVSNDDQELILGSDFEMKLESNQEIGTASGTITGTRYYSGTLYFTFQIVPKKVAGFSKASSTASSIKLKWKKHKQADGYVIYRSNAKNGSYKKVKTLTKNTVVSWTRKKNKTEKNSYYKIRAYKTVDGTRYYSSYSTILSDKSF